MRHLILKALVLSLATIVVQAQADVAVKITPTLSSVDVKHNGKMVKIARNQDQSNTIDEQFSKTSRRCPPFCIQPITLAVGVETIGEVEMLDYLKRSSNGDKSILVVDSRGIDWVKKGTIAGSTNIHYKKLSVNAAEAEDIADIVESTFGAQRGAEFWNFSSAKTLVLFCNGMWCGQAPTNIKALLKMGYPANKLKWYRGGIQSWHTLGLDTIKP